MKAWGLSSTALLRNTMGTPGNKETLVSASPLGPFSFIAFLGSDTGTSMEVPMVVKPQCRNHGVRAAPTLPAVNATKGFPLQT